MGSGFTRTNLPARTTHRNTQNTWGPNTRGHNWLVSPGSHPGASSLVTRAAKAGRGTLTPCTAREGPLPRVNSGTLPPEDAEERPAVKDRVRQGRWGLPENRASLHHPPPRSPEVQLLLLQTLVRSMPDPMRGSPSSSISSAGGGPRRHPQTLPDGVHPTPQ